jgi:hypothetical protein
VACGEWEVARSVFTTDGYGKTTDRRKDRTNETMLLCIPSVGPLCIISSRSLALEAGVRLERYVVKSTRCSTFAPVTNDVKVSRHKAGLQSATVNYRVSPRAGPWRSRRACGWNVMWQNPRGAALSPLLRTMSKCRGIRQGCNPRRLTIGYHLEQVPGAGGRRAAGTLCGKIHAVQHFRPCYERCQSVAA